MFKKFLALLLVSLMLFAVVGCDQEKEAAPAEDAPAADAPAGEVEVDENWKIGILTGTVSQNEEEYRAAENAVAKYGEDRVVLMTYPDKFMDEQDTTISNIVAMASDPDIKAIIIVQGVPGTSTGIQKAREVNPDVLFIVGTPGEDPAMVSNNADIVLGADELAMGIAVIKQAKKMGAETFIHYSFPRHMSYALLAARRDLFRENCEKEGIEFVEVDAPDPTGDAGLPGAQQFILEDVPKQVNKYGKDTAFFSTNCGMQIPLIKMVVETGALYPQPCCPSPFHGFPAALEVEVPDDKKGDIPYMVEQITNIVADKNMTGRLSTWPVPVNMMFVEGGADYAVRFAKGELADRIDQQALQDCFTDYAKTTVNVDILNEGGVEYPNYFLVLVDFLDF
ncbi:MAG: DUF3798 domain-containing protein [Eubacteriales bacterium]|nr:DUF3798 domain-containing protein [Eubacteriales bacterium]